jgi:hypothetical protein
MIIGLKNKERELVKDWRDLEAVCKQYYSKLYNAQPPSLKTAAIEAAILETLSSLLSWKLANIWQVRS